MGAGVGAGVDKLLLFPSGHLTVKAVGYGGWRVLEGHGGGVAGLGGRWWGRGAKRASCTVLLLLMMMILLSSALGACCPWVWVFNYYHFNVTRSTTTICCRHHGCHSAGAPQWCSHQAAHSSFCGVW